MKYVPLTIFICFYGFSKYFRPLESFLTPYLTSPLKNFTNSELSESVYPVWTYTYLFCSIPVFLFADLFRYKIFIIFECFCYILTYFLLLFGQTIFHMQIMQFLFGMGTSLEVAFYAFVYSAIDEKSFKKTTSYVKCATLASKFLSCVVGQLIVSMIFGDFMILNYITLGSLSIAFVISLILISSHNIQKLPVNQNSDKLLTNGAANLNHVTSDSEKNEPLSRDPHSDTIIFSNFSYFPKLFERFKTNYSNSFVWKWSLWWALGTAGFLQVGNYVQNLWILYQKENSDVYNGLAQGFATLFGAIVVFFMQYVKFPVESLGELMLSLFSIIIFILLFTMSRTIHLYVSYSCYISCRVFYQIIIVVIMYNLAKKLSKESYGLVFGFNTFVALLVQTILTLLFADKRGFALDIQSQFLIYGGYYGLIGIIFFIIGLKGMFRNQDTNSAVEPEL